MLAETAKREMPHTKGEVQELHGGLAKEAWKAQCKERRGHGGREGDFFSKRCRVMTTPPLGTVESCSVGTVSGCLNHTSGMRRARGLLLLRQGTAGVAAGMARPHSDA